MQPHKLTLVSAARLGPRDKERSNRTSRIGSAQQRLGIESLEGSVQFAEATDCRMAQVARVNMSRGGQAVYTHIIHMHLMQLIKKRREKKQNDINEERNSSLIA